MIVTRNVRCCNEPPHNEMTTVVNWTLSRIPGRMTNTVVACGS
jgi:hypothetical protein